MSAPWHIPQATLDYLRDAQISRPKPAGALRILGNIAAVFAMLVCLPMAYFTRGEGAAFFFIASAAFVWLLAQFSRGRRWHTRFRPQKTAQRLEVHVEGADRQPQLVYSMMKANLNHQQLRFEFHPQGCPSIQPGMPALLVRDFDRSLGVDGPEVLRGLMGSKLCEALLQLHLTDDVIVQDGVLIVPFPVDQPGFDRVHHLIKLFGAFVDRLLDVRSSLTELAQHDTPLHAARAWMLLAELHPAEAKFVLRQPASRGVNAVIGRAILEKLHPIDMPLEWSDRADIFRGMLGVTAVVHSSPLVERLISVDPNDETSAVALADMLDAARARLGQWPEGASVLSRLSEWLADHGDQSALAWLSERAQQPDLRKQSEHLAGRIKARLYAERAGRLALEPDARTGALSDARAGEVSIAHDAPNGV